ncbi:MAG: hypothetical protein ACE15C_09625, partial [Phycisphaerae bacterium]
MDEHDENIEKRYGDVLEGLEDLRTHIGRQTFPGVAWKQRRRSRIHIILWPALAAAAAAAAIVLAVLALGHSGTAPAPTPPLPIVQAPATTEPSMDTIESDLLVIEYLAQDKREDWINYVPADNGDDEWPIFQNEGPATDRHSSMVTLHPSATTDCKQRHNIF